MLRGDRERARQPQRSWCHIAGKRLFRLLTFAAFAVWLDAAVAAQRAEVLVSGAISLKEALQNIGALFEQQHPDVKVIFNFGASGVLQQQIERGAPVDVFVSAAVKHMDELQTKGFIVAETRRPLAANMVVLIKPAGRCLDLDSFRDLTKPVVKRIAVGNPRTVPAGQYSQDVLMSLGLWDLLHRKLILTETVRQALAYVVRGEVDAALVYATDALSTGREVQVVATAPKGSHPPVIYPIAVVKGSKVDGLAKAFVDLALSAEGQQILKTHGFRSPLSVAAR